MAAHVGERDPRRLLHHVAELAGQDQRVLALAGHPHRLDEQHVAAGAGHRQAGRDARHRRADRRLLEVLLAPERVAHARRGRSRPGPSPSPEAIFVAVLRSSVPSSRSSWRTPASRVYSVTTVCSSSSEIVDLLGLQPVALQLARPQVAARDRDLLGGRVAVEADHLHAVQQRAGDRVGDVRRRDEQHAARGRARRRGSGRGTSGSAPGPAPRAAPRSGRRASRRRPCRPRRA